MYWHWHLGPCHSMCTHTLPHMHQPTGCNTCSPAWLYSLLGHTKCMTLFNDGKDKCTDTCRPAAINADHSTFPSNSLPIHTCSTTTPATRQPTLPWDRPNPIQKPDVTLDNSQQLSLTDAWCPCLESFHEPCPERLPDTSPEAYHLPPLKQPATLPHDQVYHVPYQLQPSLLYEVQTT